jgi:phenylacetate-CoA oxygenase PaaH subunit
MGSDESEPDADDRLPDEAFQLEPDPDDDGMEPYEVFVQWERGDPHQHAETIDAPSAEMAVMLAKRNVDVRQEPLSIWTVPRRELTRTGPGDRTLVPETDRSYRSVGWYARNQVDVERRLGENSDEGVSEES